MEQFQKELDTLLTKYPNLPEFTITIRPRVVISVKSEITSTTLPKSVKMDLSMGKTAHENTESVIPTPRTPISDLKQSISYE